MEEVEVTVLIEEGDVRDLIRGRGHGKGPCRSREECGPHSSHFVCEGSPRERCRSLFHESTKHFLDGEPDSGGFFPSAVQVQQFGFYSLSIFQIALPATESSISISLSLSGGRYGRQGAMLRVRGVPSGMVLQKVRQEDLPGTFSPPIGHPTLKEIFLSSWKITDQQRCLPIPALLRVQAVAPLSFRLNLPPSSLFHRTLVTVELRTLLLLLLFLLLLTSFCPC